MNHTTRKNTMRLTTSNVSRAVLVGLLLAAGLALPASGQGVTCLPSCNVDDGKFLAISGTGLVTLSDTVLDVNLTADAGTTSFDFGVFDGDGGEIEPSTGKSRWDVGATVDFDYAIFASPPGGPEVQLDLTVSPAAPGGCSPTVVLGELIPDPACSVPSSAFPNNAWLDFTVDSSGTEGEAPSGIKVYRLEVRQMVATGITSNVFKVRTTGQVTIRLGEQPFSYAATLGALPEDVRILTPDADFENSNYDGKWSFFFDVEADQENLIVWDGDLDHGRFDGDRTCTPQPECLVAGGQDTDDPDTLNDPFEPLFEVTDDVLMEDVADGFNGTSGEPPDDIANVADLFARPPGVRYDLVFPDGRIFGNDNPSGNQEWEQFIISSAPGCDDSPTCVPDCDPSDPVDPSCPTGPFDPVGVPCADVCLTPASPGPPVIPQGVYELRVQGNDFSNLNALRLPQILCVDEIGSPCIPFRSFELGDTVFADLSGDGTQQEPGESGINGVILNLFTSGGDLIAKTATSTTENLDGDVEAGAYRFDADGGTFTVQVAPENFGPAPAPGGGVGDRVWLDADGDGAQGPVAAEPGIANVRVNLYQVSGGGDVFFGTTLTDPNGEYAFTDLPPGTYYTDVVESTVPAGLALSGGTDPSADSIPIVTTEFDPSLDFGYSDEGAALVGDYVWVDANSDGAQDPGEPGIGGVEMVLLDDSSSLVLATTTTAADGSYLFRTVSPGDYRIEVAAGNFASGGPLASYSQTADPDEGGTCAICDGETSFLLAPAQLSDLTRDFGYVAAGLHSITDTVWLDIGGDGLFDGADTPFAGVTVSLFGQGGALLATTVTDAAGDFTFTGLPDGTYTLSLSDVGGVLAGFGSTTGTTPPPFPPAQGAAGVLDVTLSGAGVIAENFGFNASSPPAPAVVGDTVWFDVNGDGIQDPGEPGLPNVKVRLINTTLGFALGQTRTDQNGLYRFIDVSPGTYVVDVLDSTLPEGLVRSFGLDPSAELTITGSEVILDRDFGYTNLTTLVGDTVWIDDDLDGTKGAGEPGIGGVLVSLIDQGADLGDPADDRVVATTRTRGDGLYLFRAAAGDYVVEVDPTTVPASLTLATSSPNPETTAQFVLALGVPDLTKDFAYTAAADFAITDVVWRDLDSNGAFDGADFGIAGVTVNLVDSRRAVVSTTTTGAGGGFSFSGLSAGEYSLQISDLGNLLAGLLPTTPAAATGSQAADTDDAVAGVVAGINFGYNDQGALAGFAGTTIKAPAANTEEQIDTLIDVNVPDFDFGYIEAGSLGDRVWFDLDDDGVQDPGEPGINGVTVTLFDPDTGVTLTTTTTGDGTYTFTGLRPDDGYVVTVDDGTLPAGLTTPTFDFDDPAAPIGTPHTAVVPLGKTGGVTDDRTDADFGYRGDGSIGDRVWNDADGGGDQNGEPGLGGVTVELLLGGVVIATDVTSGDGNYFFGNLPPGDYTVRVVPPAGFSQTFDLDGTLDHQHSLTLGLDENRTDVDFGYQEGVEGSIGDRVWLDADGDGDQEVGEAGINGVTVRLFDSGGGLVATAVTSGDGNYTFGGLDPDTYTVVVDDSTLPPGLGQTFDVEGPLDHSATVVLGLGENRDDVDFGYDECGTCEGKVTRLTLRYLGDTGAQIRVEAKKGSSTEVVFDDFVSPSGSFGVVGLPTGTPGFSGTLGTEIRIFVGGMLHTVIHTSCSVPIGPGLVSGDFEVLSGFSKHGGALCPIDGGDESVCLPAIDFETDGAGGALETGQIIDDEWAAFGVTVTTGDPINHPAMIFDSESISGADYDLGTPNQTFGGPGIGSGGEMGQPGENGVPLGKVLIISEDADSSDPDDNGAGGTITFDFAYPVRVDSVGLLDLDEGSPGSVTARDAGGSVIGSGLATSLGNNSVQTVLLGVIGVRSLEIYFPGSGAVTGLEFCIDDSVCLPNLDFEGLGAGTVVSGQFAGIQVLTDDPTNNPAMIFNSSNPTGGDTDLGTPNSDFGGPGVGAGGGAGQDGENAVDLGKVLIISEDADSGNPDDNAAGGTIYFIFDQPVFTTSVAILDIDGLEATGMVEAFDAEAGGGMIALAMMQTYGDNSFQTVPLVAGGVRRLEVHFPSSGAVAGINFCDDCVSIRVRDDFDHAAFDNNDGPDDWSADWIENDPKSGGAGPTAGQVRVGSGTLRLDDYPNTGGQPSLAREVDLSGASTATLHFDFDTSSKVDKDDAVTVEISDDGGGTWHTLEVITDIHGATWEERSFDVTPFISDRTQVRFRVSNKYGGEGEYFWVGYVEIETGCGGGTLLVRDEFNHRLFSNNDGPDDWEGGWQEDDPGKNGAGPAAGHVKVYNNALKLHDNPNTGGEPSAAREVDLTGFTSATFSYDWSTTSGVDRSDAIAVEVSANGGGSWTVLATITDVKGSHSGSDSHDISAFISADTTIRFRVANLYGGSSEYFYADNVQIEAEGSEVAPPAPTEPGDPKPERPADGGFR